MFIWYISLYEPLPFRSKDVRPMRTGNLTEKMVSDGHDVELWLPGFDHVKKKHHTNKSVTEKIDNNLTIQYIKSIGYKSDVSFKRFLNNKYVAKEFARIASSKKRLPEIILTQVPSLELSEAVMEFAMKNNIPYIVDVRDPWPNIYKRLLPKFLQFLYPLLFRYEIFRAKKIYKNAANITAVSNTFLLNGLSYAGRIKEKHDIVFPIGYSTNNNFKYSLNVTEKYKNLKDKFIVFFSGSLGMNFDLKTVLKASRQLEKENLDIYIVIAGKGKGENLLENYSKKCEKFIFLNWLPLEELRYLLDIASVGLAPFPKGALNSLPNKPYEYMSASLPIISSLKGELANLIEKYNVGINYEAENVKALTIAIKSLYHDRKACKKMSINSYELLKNKFNSTVIYSNFSSYLKERSKHLKNDYR
jgi:glycosyltransferase involved in cell wall biosynthesis